MSMMNFKIDENLPVEAADLLRHHGHDAATVIEQNMSGETDESIAAVCRREGRVLITLDLDFADIRTYPPSQYPGLIVMRVRQQNKTTVTSMIERISHAIGQEVLSGKLWIVDEERIRIRE